MGKSGSKKIIIIIAAIVCVVLVAVVIGVISKDSAPQNPNGPNSSYDDNESADTAPSHISEVPDGYIGIYSAEDLQNISKNMRANYILMNDIDLSGFEITPFELTYSGTFNGNNYTISNYYSHSPLFPYITDASILNLNFANSTIDRMTEFDGVTFSGNENLGGIVGEVAFGSGMCRINNCSFNGTIIVYGGSEQYGENYSKIGGIIGLLRGDNSSVTNCSFSGEINVSTGYINYVGGVVGCAFEESEKIELCSSSGIIKSDNKVSYLGGVVGATYSCPIYNCYSSIDIAATYCDSIGGVVGNLSESDARFVYYNGSITYDSLYTGLPFVWDEERLKADETAGSIAGSIYYSNIQYCYYIESSYDAIGDGTPFANVSALSSEEMTQSESYYGFDFDFTWIMGNNDYPYPVLS